MLTTVVGSFPFKLKTPNSFSDKLKHVFGTYDPYKLAIKDIVTDELNAGIDIVCDGGVRENMNMINIFSRHMQGMKIEDGTTVIKSKILPSYKDITVDDVNTAKRVLDDYLVKNENNLTEDEISNKGVKAVVTGPSTMIYASRIESFYKNKDDAIFDYAHAFNSELKAIEEKTEAKYIQVDEPIWSTGVADMSVASEAIDILIDGIDLPIAIHACGDISEIYKVLANLNVDILDLEFAGNSNNFKIFKNNISKFKGKKIGFGCLNSAVDRVDDKYSTGDLISKAIEIIGKDNLLLDPDCGLGKLSHENAFKKLQLMCNLKNEFNS
ncbi:methionine synthase [Methanobrevibacter sp. 87.7]|uniref:methionine synthase n=1 Tax=Methanobrevibacter sp. 87.7 TaxID=387957 RepID=UPI000B504AF7|nr:methionine synthase [Methanobrevibacter sp. 87.7]OWT32616.1 methionine synthase [Methanobrevibacter sp. 87.7]